MNDIDVLAMSVGDLVGVCNGGGWNTIAELRTVARKTSTQAILDDGSRWNKYGRKVGQTSWSRSFLVTAEDARQRISAQVAERIHNGLVRKVRDLKLSEITDKGLLAILQIAADNARLTNG